MKLSSFFSGRTISQEFKKKAEMQQQNHDVAIKKNKKKRNEMALVTLGYIFQEIK